MTLDAVVIGIVVTLRTHGERMINVSLGRNLRTHFLLSLVYQGLRLDNTTLRRVNTHTQDRSHSYSVLSMIFTPQLTHFTLRPMKLVTKKQRIHSSWPMISGRKCLRHLIMLLKGTMGLEMVFEQCLRWGLIKFRSIFLFHSLLQLGFVIFQNLLSF